MTSNHRDSYPFWGRRIRASPQVRRSVVGAATDVRGRASRCRGAHNRSASPAARLTLQTAIFWSITSRCLTSGSSCMPPRRPAVDHGRLLAGARGLQAGGDRDHRKHVRRSGGACPGDRRVQAMTAGCQRRWWWVRSIRSRSRCAFAAVIHEYRDSGRASAAG